MSAVVHGEEDSSENTIHEVKASEILAEIQKCGPVEYDNAKVIGDIDLSKLDLRTTHINKTADEIEFCNGFIGR